MEGDAGTTAKKQNYVLHSLTGIILIVLTGVKFNMGAVSQEGILALGRFAMPFFFIISGYYLFSEDGHSERALPRKIKHIFGIIIFLKLTFLALDIIYYFAGIVTMDYLIKAFVISEETTMHVWFVYALFLLYIWWYLMIRYDLNVKGISSVLSVVVLVLSLFFGVVLRGFGVDEIGGVSTLYINEVIYPFIGIPFFTIGYYLHMYHKEFDMRFSTRTLVVLTVLGAILPFLTSFTIPSSTLYLGSILTSVGLFMLTFRVPEDRLRCRATEFIGRCLKPFLYMFFPAVVFFMQNVGLKWLKYNAVAYAAVGAFASIAANLLLSYTAYRAIMYFGRKRPASA
ncbi:MAG: acyltransferase family protein [Candidatus Methanomethylophilaceae archaeon]